MEMKLVGLLKVWLVLVVATSTAMSLSAEKSETKAEAVPEGDFHEHTTESSSSPSPEKSTEREVAVTGTRGAVKYSGAKTEKVERVLGKPFFYGRRFELRKDSKKKEERGEMYSPLITNPIRALPSNSTDPEEGALKQHQNEILTSIREFMRETTEESLSESESGDPKETATEAAAAAAAAAAEVPEEDFDGDESSKGSRSRQEGDRSLLVVLPFKAEGKNMEELFTKSPLVKVIESNERDNSKGKITSWDPPGTTPAAVTTEREETTPTTLRDFVTKRRWRPSQRYRTTTEPQTSPTTTENVLKTYTTYDDVELVTRRFDNPTIDPHIFANHKYDADFSTSNPIFKHFRNKTTRDHPKQEENTTTEESAPFSSTQIPKEVKSKPKRKGQRRKPTTEGPPRPEELTKILDILPPDVKNLILHMGLNKANKEQEGSSNNFRLERPPQPVIDPMSYAVFKPLPLEGPNENRKFVPDDMKDFLASFGLLPTGGRVQKSMRAETGTTEKKPLEDLSGVNLDFLPDDLKALVQEMGLVKSENKKEPTRIHIFNPSNHSIAQSEEDFEKLNAILSSIKTTVNKSESLTPEMQSEIIDKLRDLDNLRYKTGNLSEINNEIKKIVVENKLSNDADVRVTSKRATKLNDGPDPLMFSEESLLKNDVKRQDNSTNTSFSSSSSSSSAFGGASSSSSSSSSSAFGGASSSSSSSSSASGDASASASSASASEGDSPTATTTEEPPNIEALKESFGGGETAADDADIESSLPPKRPNGLYLLLDWNSFLEVGTDDDSRRVNLRFQPKIGDSRNFLPVSVP